MALHSALVFMLTVTFLEVAWCFPSGAPSSTCDTMFPQHGISAQSGDAPYTLTLSSTQYSANDAIIITLSGSADFRGFLIQARLEADDSERVGTFTVLDADRNLQPQCAGEAVTHTNRDDKSEVRVSWQAPAYPGRFFFRATVVQAFSTIWTDIRSEVVVEAVATEPTSTQISRSTAATTVTMRPTEPPRDVEIDLSGCGDTHGCFRYPADCDLETCDMAATWSAVQDDSVTFTLMRRDEGWVALAFSEDRQMGEDYVLMCLEDGDSVRVASRYNLNDFLGHRNVALNDEEYGLMDATTSSRDGQIRCQVTRHVDASTVRGGSNDDEDRFSDISDRFRLFLGTGPVSGGIPQFHSEIPQISPERVRVASQLVDVTGDGEDREVGGATSFFIRIFTFLTQWFSSLFD